MAKNKNGKWSRETFDGKGNVRTEDIQMFVSQRFLKSVGPRSGSDPEGLAVAQRRPRGPLAFTLGAPQHGTKTGAIFLLLSF